MKTNETLKVGCVVMAAGNAARYGENKLLAELDGKPVAAHVLDAIPCRKLAQVVVVTGYDAVEALALARGFRVLRNDRPELGVSRTIRLGTEALSGCDAIAYVVADQPRLRRESFSKLADLWLANPDRIVGLAHGGVRGNPCIFPADCFPALLALTGDTGGSAVIRAMPERLLLMETDAAELTDVDTPGALEALRQR